MAPQYWLLKSEAEDYSWQRLLQEKVAIWDGVRNFQARNYMQQMRLGDLALFYHTGSERRILGIAKVVQEARPDPVDDTGRFVVVKIEAIQTLPHVISLEKIKAEPRLAGLAMLRQPRLSVMPVSTDQWQILLEMGGVTRLEEA